MTRSDPEGVEALYPFLYAEKNDETQVMEDVRRSTVVKAQEIVEIRDSLASCYADDLVRCAERMAEAFRNGGRLYTFGNGGSSTDAQSVTQLFLHPPPPARPLPSVSLAQDVAVLTALSNDVGFEVVFARQLAAFARRGDVVMGLSTSGGSVNLLRAFEEAGRRGLLRIGLAGYDGGKMAGRGVVDHLFVVPSSSVHRIQEAQTTLYHVLWELTQQALHS